MKRVTIGIHAYEGPDRLRTTVRSVIENMPAIDLVLLPDGADAATRSAIASFAHLPVLPSEEPCGAAAAFNRLASRDRADVVILLESGCRVTPGWDQLLTAALDDPANGLAGPSTNRCWNEQCRYPNCPDSEPEIARVAREAATAEGRRVRTLVPLYSLADFCYAVRRDVIDAIGAADESYGLGPCWEMDYNIRAARAGFRGVWVCGAYVHRAALTRRRQVEEARRFDASKHIYQDKFCGARLRGDKTDYRTHCVGDACPNFAPASLMRLRGVRNGAVEAPARASLSPSILTSPRVSPREPLVSCIMPTFNRRSVVPLAIQCFLRQDYPHRELIVVDDGDDPVGDLVSAVTGVRYCRLSPRRTIGSKRNFACEQARGEFVAHWDDDDWYAPERLRYQIAPLIANQADITGLEARFVLDTVQGRFWTTRRDLHQRMFLGDVHGGTLVFRRRLFAEGLRYPDADLAEDAWLLKTALNRGQRLLRLDNQGVFVYVRHGRNVWRDCVPGRFLNPDGWAPVSPPALFSAADLSAYKRATASL